MAYLPQDRAARFAALERWNELPAKRAGHLWLAEVPVTESIVGRPPAKRCPFFAQLFVAAADGDLAGPNSTEWPSPCASARSVWMSTSLSADHRLQAWTTGHQPFFPDLSDQRFTTERRSSTHASTNTFRVGLAHL